ncbi:MFS transporter [Hydrogenivirga sp.]
MIKKLSFGLFDTGETILGALVFSTFFPLYITQHISTSLYSFLYGLSFLLSFALALYLGRLADRRAVRKPLFSLFGALVSLLCALVGLSLSYPGLALLFFLLLAVSHQQALVFYNSLLLGFERRGFTSGLGVALGYVGSAVALIFLARHLRSPEVYYFVSLIFLIFLVPSLLTLENPPQKEEVSLKEVFRDKKFLLLILSILTVTEVANTLVAMMGVYLREVFSLENSDIYRVIGLSALGGVLGGVFWGRLSDAFGVKKVFPLGFILWSLFLITLPLAGKSLILLWGFLAGVSLSHIWTTSRVLILSEFPEGEASVRLSFLSLTERVASTLGLFIWGILLLLTEGDFRLSAGLMALFPLLGLLLFVYMRSRRLI